MSFIPRKLEYILSYGTGDDGLGPYETVKLTGHRSSVSAVIAGGAGMGQLQVRIFGMTQSMMNRLSTVGKMPLVMRSNLITVLAGDDKSGMSQVFSGTIISAWADMQAAPNVGFVIQALAGAIEAMIPVEPTSHRGSVDAADLLKEIAGKMGCGFENNGVHAMLSTPYFPGTARTQAESVVRACGCEWNGIENGVLAIWPKGGSRAGPIPLIAPQTGMVGYPTYTAMGIIVNTLYNPTLRHGARVKVESELTPACGEWVVTILTHELEANTPNGKWFTQAQLGVPGYVVTG